MKIKPKKLTAEEINEIESAYCMPRDANSKYSWDNEVAKLLHHVAALEKELENTRLYGLNYRADGPPRPILECGNQRGSFIFYEGELWWVYLFSWVGPCRMRNLAGVEQDIANDAIVQHFVKVDE